MVVACVAWQVRGQRLEDGVEIVALKPCTLRIVEGRWRQDLHAIIHQCFYFFRVAFFFRSLDLLVLDMSLEGSH